MAGERGAAHGRPAGSEAGAVAPQQREAAGLDRLNRLSGPRAEEALLACCGSRRWARRMAGERPFASAEALLAAADQAWRDLAPVDRREAFRAHPRIGERKPAAPGTGGRSRRWSGEEQRGTRDASADLLRRLAEANRVYEERFGHIFIVCASGRSAGEMLALLEERLGNDPAAELAAAAEEQRKITRLRLERLLEETAP